MSKYKYIKMLFTGALVFFFFVEPVFGGAWTRTKGGLYSQLTFNYYTTDENFDDDGDRVDFSQNGEFKDTNLSLYLEYGITDDFTLLGSIPYKWLEYEDDTILERTNGIADLELGLKYRLHAFQSGVLSVQGLLKVPEAYDTDDAIPLGNDQYDYEVRFLYGQSLYPSIPGYFNVEIGYRFRAEAPADEFRFLVECGTNFTENVYGRVKLDGIFGMDNADSVSATSTNPTTTLDYDLGKLDVALGYKTEKGWGIEVGYRPEIYGKNTACGENWSLAVIYQMD